MKRLFLSLALICLLTIAYQPQVQAQSPSKGDSGVEIIAVKMYADWCGKCQEMDPKLSNVKPQFENRPILFTRFDMTDSFRTGQSEKLASLLGLQDLFQEHKGRTGYMVLLSAKNHELLKTLGSSLSEEELKSEIESVL